MNEFTLIPSKKLYPKMEDVYVSIHDNIIFIYNESIKPITKIRRYTIDNLVIAQFEQNKIEWLQ